MRISTLILLAALGLAPAVTTIEAQEKSGSGSPAPPLPRVIKKAQKSAVEVLVDGQLKGGGAFVAKDGLIITAAHLFANAGAIFEVITAENKRFPAKLIAFDKGHDLALLQAKPDGKEAQNFPILTVSKKIPATGRRIFNLGNALRNRGVVMAGTVAQDEIMFNELSESNGYIANYLVGAMTPSLTSGGVWINTRGEIAGVQSARLNDEKLKSGLGIIVPPQAVSRLIETRKTPATPDIGGWIWEVWTADKSFLKSIPPGTEGLVITWLRKGGPLDKAGLKRLDVILAIDGKSVSRRVEFLSLLRKKKPGDIVKLKIRTPKVEATREVSLELESLEKYWLEKPGK